MGWPERKPGNLLPCAMNLLKIPFLVDDNHHMRVLLGEILKALGVRHIFEASDGAQGLPQMMRNHDIDIIAADLSMQPLDQDSTSSACCAARPESPNQMCPVIMITGHSTQARVQEARRNAGVSSREFLAKPLTARGVGRADDAGDRPPRPFVKSASYFKPRPSPPRRSTFRGPLRRQGAAPQQSAVVRDSERLPADFRSADSKSKRCRLLSRKLSRRRVPAKSGSFQHDPTTGHRPEEGRSWRARPSRPRPSCSRGVWCW